MKYTLEEYKRFIYKLHDSVESLLYTPPELRSNKVIELHNRLNLMIASIEHKEEPGEIKLKRKMI